MKPALRESFYRVLSEAIADMIDTVWADGGALTFRFYLNPRPGWN